MSEATDVVDRQVTAAQARDLDTFLSFYAKDVTIRQFDGTVAAAGTEGLRAFYGPGLRDSPQLNLRILNRIAIGDYVIDEEEVTGLNAAGFPPTIHSAVAYHVRDGLIQDVIMLM
jgi:hypothetical protein